MTIVSQRLARRHFLRGTGAALLSLPFLDAMSPLMRASSAADKTTSDSAPKRFVAACATLGFHTPFLFPEKPGTDYELTPYLKCLAGHRDKFTVLSGLSHPEQQGNNGHASELTWLTSAERPGLAGFRNTVSIDQEIAQRIGHETRYPFLCLSTSGRSMSWSSSGVEIPGESSPAKLFKALFMEGTPQEVAAEFRRLERGQSILDTVQDQANQLERSLGGRDKNKLDEYLTAVRDLEIRLQQSQGWSKKPKPKVDDQLPKDVQDKNDAIAKQDMLYDMIALTLQTDSTRTVTFQLSGMNAVPSNIAGVSNDWHNLSHHGKDPDKINELRLIEMAEFEAFNRFLNRLNSIEENGQSLLDHTAILFGSNLGNASAHDWHNLPILVAGGGFRHGAYVAYDAQKNVPLANLFVSFAQYMGIEIEKFGSSTSAGVPGLERMG